MSVSNKGKESDKKKIIVDEEVDEGEYNLVRNGST